MTLHCFLPEDLIDSHCHARGLEHSYKTTPYQVLSEAKNGLIRISIIEPNPSPPITTLEAHSAYSEIVDADSKKLALPEQYFWFGLTDKNIPAFKLVLRYRRVAGGKIYPIAENGESVTTGAQIGVAHDSTIVAIMKAARAEIKVVQVHCDDPMIILAEGNTIRAEYEYVARIIELGKQVPGVKIIISHVSCIQSAELILKAQRDGMDIAMEIMPHYLMFDSDGTNWNPRLNPVFYHCFNNLRGKEHREYLTELLLLDNERIWGASDTASHTEHEKLESAGKPKMIGGIPSNLEMVPAFITVGKQLGLSDKRLGDLLSRRPAKFLNLPTSRREIKYRLVRKVDELQYNHGIVTNPWNGVELLFPIQQ